MAGENTNGATSAQYDAVIVGGGFGGCYLLKYHIPTYHKVAAVPHADFTLGRLLRDAGFKTRIIEAAPRLGGVWAWNRYPGARVDVEMPYYGFSHPEIWSTFIHKERYPSDTDLRAYFDHVADVWNLKKDVDFKTQVTKASFQEDTGTWSIEAANGSRYNCRWFIAATGTSFRQYMPDWAGMEKFEGTIAHSSLWPDNVDLSNKRVAIIGAGSTAIQVMQEAAKVASHVTQYIKSPNLALPMRQRNITEDEVYANRPIYPHVFGALKNTFAGLPTVGIGKGTFDVSDTEREAVWEEGWRRGGFNWSIGGFADTLRDPKANRAAYDFWQKKTAPRVRDPRKKELLCPKEPPYYIGTKRPSLEQDYYEACDQPHVDITDSPIERFTATSIVNADGEKPFDVVAICTGYDAVTGGLRTMGIKGRGGLGLEEKWKDGVSTHLGMMVNGFPNFYIAYGPQAPTSHTNGPPFLEMQTEWIAQAIIQQRDQGYDVVEAKQAEEDKWRKSVSDLASTTLSIHTNSWYMGANVPGKKREYLLYLGGLPTWHAACKNALEDWKGFDVGSIQS